ncbi:MAG TPA: hypothetical protein VGT60_07215 [Candidatus Limnocylindria bacterium]|nr:hypothetical protein [Candidatus Limnocylindria bacterium]
MIGSPLYRIEPGHLAALLALGVVAIALWPFRRPDLRRLAPIDRLLVGLLLGSAAVHAGLVIGNDHGPAVGLLFIVDAALLAAIARRVLRGSRPGRLGGAVLVGSVVAYWLAMANEPPDQLGLVTKLAELLALAIVARPLPGARPRRLRSLAGGVGLCLLVVGTAASSWAGGFRAAAAEPGAVAGHTVHGGSVPPPGTLFPASPAREATPAERAAANALLAATRSSLARYADPAAAAADGYRVNGLAGIDFHAANPAYERDGRVFDPAHPESLVYAVAPNGRPVLLGAVFQMPELGQAGPAIGGPLTTWHGHEQVCISLTPPALVGLLGPLGTCPVGAILLPRTAQMIHVWIVPGAPDPFGDLGEAWKRAYLGSVAARP